MLVLESLGVVLGEVLDVPEQVDHFVVSEDSVLSLVELVLDDA